MENKKPRREIVRCYTGSDLLRFGDTVYEPLVEGIMHRGDLVMMSGLPKSNKSTFAMQLACSLSTGTPFLGTLSVPKPGTTWYFSTEGKDDEMRERLLRMSHAVPVDLDRIKLFCSSQFKVNTPIGQKIITDTVTRYADSLPDLIILDSLYSCFKGKLTEDDVVNEYLTILRNFSEICGDATIFLFHHLKKQIKTPTGDLIRQDTNDSFGSVFFVGQADHVFTIAKSNKNKMDRLVTCDVQRSNRIVDELYLHLNQPDPFYLSLANKHDAERDAVIKLLTTAKTGLSAQEIIETADISKSLGYIILGELERNNRVTKSKGYAGLYTLAKAGISGEVFENSPISIL